MRTKTKNKFLVFTPAKAILQMKRSGRGRNENQANMTNLTFPPRAHVHYQSHRSEKLVDTSLQADGFDNEILTLNCKCLPVWEQQP